MSGGSAADAAQHAGGVDRAGLEGSAEDKGWEATAAALDTARVLAPYRR